MTEGLAAALQVRLRTLAFLFFILCSVVYLFVDIGTCSSYISSWLGFLPMQASSSWQVLLLVALCGADAPQCMRARRCGWVLLVRWMF